MSPAFAVSCVALLGAALPLRATEVRPNVLFLMADDLRPELASYGSVALTPNLDRLAARSLQFDRAYCQQAVCNPSRSSMLTGRRPSTLGLWNNGTHFRERNPDVPTLPLWFKEHGYTTRCAGKIFHNWHTEVRGDPRSWSAPEFLHYESHGHDEPKTPSPLPPNLASPAPRRYTDVPLYECRDVPDDAYYDGRVAAEAVRVLGELAAAPDPFFLAVGFWKPHAPFNAPKRYWDLYDRETLPPWEEAPPADVPPLALHDSREVRGLPPSQVTFTPAQAKEMRHGYLACISYFDAQLGKVLDALDRSGARDRTIIVFASDHGYHLGEHGLWGKTSNFEADARVPLLVSVPGSPSAGRRTDSLAELLDLFPTLSELCSLPQAPGLEGSSLVPVLRDPARPAKDAAFTEHPRPAYFDREPPGTPAAIGFSVRTAEARYTEWRDWTTGTVVARELYEEAQGPFERRNRVDEASFAALRDAAAARLARQFPPGPPSARFNSRPVATPVPAPSGKP
jgi:iduronate 2-sulfatase